MKPYRERSRKLYFKNFFGICMILLGAFMLIEHIYAWGVLSFWDFIGHEWLGFTLIIFGIILNLDFTVPVSFELKGIWKKIKSIWKKK